MNVASTGKSASDTSIMFIGAEKLFPGFYKHHESVEMTTGSSRRSVY